MNKINKKYENDFKREKKLFLKNNDIAIEAVDITYNDIAIDNIEEIQQYTKKVIQEFRTLEEHRGLCFPVSYSILPVVASILKEQYVYLSVGRILKDGIDIFKVGSQNDFRKRMEQSYIYGRNLHAWITTASGTIIDPTIMNEKIIYGTPSKLFEQYNYLFEVYEIYDCSILDSIKDLNKTFDSNLVMLKKSFQK